MNIKTNNTASDQTGAWYQRPKNLSFWHPSPGHLERSRHKFYRVILSHPYTSAKFCPNPSSFPEAICEN